VTAGRTGVVLEHARVVHPDGIRRESLAFAKGLVSAASAGALRLDLRDHLIFPGLINAHDHLQLNNVPPLPHAGPFGNSYDWIDAIEAHRSDPRVVAAVGVPSELRHWQGGVKNVLAGATTVAHHDPWNASFDDPDFPVGLLRGFGWSHSLRLSEPRGDQPPRYGPSVRASFLETPHAEPWIIHLAEGTDTIARDELAQLDALGCLAANTVLVHGLGLSDEDVDRVIERRASVVWCPASNVWMFGRTLEPRVIRRLFEAGRLALGSDSRLTGSRDLLDELSFAAAHSDLSPRALLSLVTGRNAEVLGLKHCGALELGQHADCVIVRSGGDPFEALLASGRGSLRAVVRGGAPLIADPDFAAWFEQCGIATVQALLDGRPKLIAKQLLRPDMIAIEPGLEIETGPCAT
jgi:cytosine/adenosine deaminase-related metal-dependent hydrolase